MEKVTCVLAVIEEPEEGAAVLGKAVAVARRFGARVDLMICEVKHAQAFSTLCSTSGYDEVTLSSVHRGAIPLHEIILRRVRETRPDIVVKSPAGSRPLHPVTLADNDWELAQECPVPVLLVRNRPWADPVRFAAAVDVSDRDTEDVTRAILHTAGYLAMGFHGNLDILYSERELHDEALRMERAVKLAQLVREFHVGCERIQVLTGDPGTVLPRVAEKRKYDVLVLGAKSRQQGIRSVFGTTVSRTVEATEGDVVLVKAPARGADNGEPRGSSREQRSHEFEQFV
jgi:nucleotide-binding universal stress UspA family protein